jgi:CBS-domain-containing membrane protein
MIDCSAKFFHSVIICSSTKKNSVVLARKRTIRPSDRRLSAKLAPNFSDRGCHVVSATDPHGRILGFLDRSRYYFFQVAPQLYSRG